MKTRFILFSCLFLGLASCDIIDFPIRVHENSNAGQVNYPEVDSSEINVTTQKVMVEEFTGHECSTCPISTAQLVAQQEASAGEIILTAIHAGYLSAPVPSKGLITDFRTPYGDEIDRIYSPTAHGVPCVLINREKVDDGTNLEVYTQGDWTEPIDDEIGAQCLLGLGIAANYLADSNALAISVSGVAVTNLIGEHRLVLLCVEDRVIDAQKDQYLNPDEYPDKVNPEYEHRHVLRGLLSSSGNVFGDKVFSDQLNAGEWFGGNYYYAVPGNVVDPGNCYIVAYVLNAETEEVIQVEEVHVQQD